MVQCICRQIHFALAGGKIADVGKMSYDEAVAHLHSLMRDHAVDLFVDWLDLLSNDDLVLSQITLL